jgi:hypothetical protein
MADYIPGSDSKFSEWITHTYPYATDANNIMRWEIPASAVSEALSAAVTDFNVKYLTATNPETRTPGAITAKTEARKLLEDLIRKYIKSYITYNPNVTDEDRRNMQLPIHDDKPTPIPPPKEDVFLEIDFSKRQEHDIVLKNKEGKRSKPLNAHGFEVWRKVGGNAPTSDTDFSYAGFSTHSPFTIKYALEDTGKTVWYRVHWVNQKNEPGPWSEIVSVIVT